MNITYINTALGSEEQESVFWYSLIVQWNPKGQCCATFLKQLILGQNPPSLSLLRCYKVTLYMTLHTFRGNILNHVQGVTTATPWWIPTRVNSDAAQPRSRTELPEPQNFITIHSNSAHYFAGNLASLLDYRYHYFIILYFISIVIITSH